METARESDQEQEADCKVSLQSRLKDKKGFISRHSLSSLSKRRPFSRKPSSWRHPGGTVSETEETETDFSECETESGAKEVVAGVRRRPGHVNSFTFSSLSMFRRQHSSGAGADSHPGQGKKDGSRSPALISQLSIESAIEEERVVLSDADKDTIVIPKHVTSPSRSPNRKFREATDKVGDKIRSLFKESKDRGDKSYGGRSASAGRSDTIEEETTEDVEAERQGGVSRAYSLNAKQLSKPLLQSHSSTESTDVPSTPKSTPTRTKKRLSLRKNKSIEAAAANDIVLASQQKLQRLSRGGAGVKPQERKFELTGDEWDVCLANELHQSLSDCQHQQQLHPATASDSLGDSFRLAIHQVEGLTEKCSQEAAAASNEVLSGVQTDLSGQEVSRLKDTPVLGDKRCYGGMMSETGQDIRDITSESDQDDIRKTVRKMSCNVILLSFFSPCNSLQCNVKKDIF